MLIAGQQPGGQLTVTSEVENYPGFADAIDGSWLMAQMRTQAERVGTRFEADTIVSVDLDVRPFRLLGESGTTYLADALIIATDAKARWLGLDSEARLRGQGVSACATCDGFFFRNREVVVVGGGNTAVEEALFLSNIAAKVTLVHRRSALSAKRILQERLYAPAVAAEADRSGPAPLPFSGKAVLVTGAARGIGRATAEAFARVGARVAMLDIANPAAYRTAEGYRVATMAEFDEAIAAVRRLGPEPLKLVGDVRDFAAMQQAAAETIRRFGRLDVAVANAGFVNWHPFDQGRPEQWREVIDTNVHGV